MLRHFFLMWEDKRLKYEGENTGSDAYRPAECRSSSTCEAVKSQQTEPELQTLSGRSMYKHVGATTHRSVSSLAGLQRAHDTPQPPGGQRCLEQSLLDGKALAISCHVSRTGLKEQHERWAGCPPSLGAWELQLTPRHPEEDRPPVASLGRDPSPESQVWFQLNACILHHHEVEKP